jgi:hypothetical protein
MKAEATDARGYFFGDHTQDQLTAIARGTFADLVRELGVSVFVGLFTSILILFYLCTRSLLAYLARELGPVFAATRVPHGPPHQVRIFIDEHGEVRVWLAGVPH